MRLRSGPPTCSTPRIRGRLPVPQPPRQCQRCAGPLGDREVSIFVTELRGCQSVGTSCWRLCERCGRAVAAYLQRRREVLAPTDQAEGLNRKRPSNGATNDE